MLFPAAKNMDWIIGIDFHKVIPVPPFLPGWPIHPFFGPIYVWLTPKYPEINVFINNQPAVAVGGTSYSVHIPMGIPTDLMNTTWWRRAFLNVPKVLMLTAMVTVVNISLGLAAALIPTPSKASQDFIKDVTGIDIESNSSVLNSISGTIANFTKWQTWVQLLMSALPYPLSNGSPGIANPTVLVNGAPLATGAPLTTISCSDIPVGLFPNAVTIATSNVFVGLSMKQFLQGLGSTLVKGLIKEGVGKVYAGAKNNPLDKFDPEVQAKLKQQEVEVAAAANTNSKKKNASTQNQKGKNCR